MFQLNMNCGAMWTAIQRTAIAFAIAVAVLSTDHLLAQSTVHVVQPNETLSEIAVDHGTDTEVLLRLNNLSDEDLIWVGLRLRLTAEPAVGSDESTALVGDALAANDVRSSVTRSATDNEQDVDTDRSSLAQQESSIRLTPLPPIAATQPIPQVSNGSTTSAPESSTVVHVVQENESLGVLAQLHGTTVGDIVQANGIADANLVVPGQQIMIPATGQRLEDDSGDDLLRNLSEPQPFDLAEVQSVASLGAVTTAAPGPVIAEGFHVHEEFPMRTGKWIDVDLSEQRVVAYEGKEAVRAFIVSTGLPATPTIVGTFNIWAKTPLQDMSGGSRAAGDYYYLEDVQWVQYFFEDYAFHGTYWHNNFGRPMSRGCVNMTNEDAKWLYEWANPTFTESGWLISTADNPGTLVVVHE